MDTGTRTPFYEQLRPLWDSLEMSCTERNLHFRDYAPLGYFCSYWPEELALAAGWEPLRVLPAAGPGTPARLPTYCCSVARACLEEAETSLPEAGSTCFGFAHTCDTMQCLGQVWPPVTGARTVTFVPPVALQAEGVLEYTVEELKNTARHLEEHGGREVSSENLQQAIKLNNRARKAAERLDKLRPFYPSPFIDGLLRAGQLTPRARFAAILEDILPSLEEQAGEEEQRPGLLLSGAVLENESLHEMIEELGGRVVAGDTCTGYRHFAVPVEEDQEPFRALARRFITRPHCPCRHRGTGARAEYLAGRARQRGARGAVLALRKYCDPHAWDAVAISQKLREAGIPVIILEMETATPGGQERTRLQAFLESL